MKPTTTFTLNGRPVQSDADPNQLLITFLREDQHIKTVKDGCSGQGFCGACMVEINGKPALACKTPLSRCQNASITTLEGFPAVIRETLAHAFIQNGAVQCGYCTPGMLTRAKLLLQLNPQPTRVEVAAALKSNYCRCTGYHKIIDAILEASRILQSPHLSPPPPPASTAVGDRHPKYKAWEKAMGMDPFVTDLFFPDMVHAALRFSDHPRALVRSIDISSAAQLPGVIRIITAQDIPGERFNGLITHDWPLMTAVGETTRCIGDVLAAVAAESESIARQAALLIHVDYEILSPLTDLMEAENSPIHIHPNGNLLESCIIQRGEPIGSILAKSAWVASGRFETQRIEHAFLETEAAAATPWENDGLEIWSQGQGVYVERTLLSRLLNLPENRIKINQVASGGGFGGKEDLTVQGHAALLARLLRQTVRVRLNRGESLRMHPKRHPMILDYQLGCDASGKLTGLKAHIIGDTGAYASVGAKVLERAAGHATGAYHIPHVDIEAKALYTNNIPCGAMRGFGVPQAAFAIESCIDELCRLGNFDRWRFRWDNALTEGAQTATGQVLTNAVGVRPCLEALEKTFRQYPNAGIACGIKNTGVGNGVTDYSMVKIEIAAPNHIILHHGWTEMGQGVHTIGIQILCNETGINPEWVEVRVCTAAEARAGMTTASRGTSLLGNAVRVTAQQLALDLKSHTLTELTGKSYSGEWRYEKTTPPGAPGAAITHYSYGYAAQLVILDDAGEIREVHAAHDVGKAINPTLCESQIQGSVHMGLGYALSENLPLDNGHLVSENLRDLGILRVDQTPPIHVALVEIPDPNGPHGAKGVGEIGLVPTAAAVANAFSLFHQKRYFKLPLK